MISTAGMRLSRSLANPVAGMVSSTMCSPSQVTSKADFPTQIFSPLISTEGLSQGSSANNQSFGVLFDIDGVITRGGQALPKAREALMKLIDTRNQEFRVPVMFVTNAGSMLRQEKANQLNKLLGFDVIKEENVLMSHSPLRLFEEFKDKHVLVSGQGPCREIAHGLGYKKVTTVDEYSNMFTQLDRIDHKHKTFPACGKVLERYAPKVEALILFGPPLKWEQHLQLTLDILLSNGHPTGDISEFAYPHIPILACNIDLVWMAESVMPRIAHGAYIHCLEELYKKLTGYDLKYTAICGKPSILTYHYAAHCVNKLARAIRAQIGEASEENKRVQRIYCIGDNVNSDIIGANLFDRYASLVPKRPRRNSTGNSAALYEDKHFASSPRVDTCYSVLVKTGVFTNKSVLGNELFHTHRDFPSDQDLLSPDFTTCCVNSAVDLILDREVSTELQSSHR